jgi:uncharacterized protein (TIGR02678 family)
MVSGLIPKYSTQRPAEEVRRAHAVLLRHPVLEASSDPEGYRLARRHLGTLRTWHQHRTGWRILARGHTVRLVRAASILPMGVLHPELTAPRDVACLVWALAFAHHPQVAGRGIGCQFLLTEVATAIAEASRESGAPLEFTRRADAQSLRRALRALVDLGLLRAVDGSDEAWLAGALGMRCTSSPTPRPPSSPGWIGRHSMRCSSTRGKQRRAVPAAWRRSRTPRH